MIATTIISSIRVKPFCTLFMDSPLEDLKESGPRCVCGDLLCNRCATSTFTRYAKDRLPRLEEFLKFLHGFIRLPRDRSPPPRMLSGGHHTSDFNVGNTSTIWGVFLTKVTPLVTDFAPRASPRRAPPITASQGRRDRRRSTWGNGALRSRVPQGPSFREGVPSSPPSRSSRVRFPARPCAFAAASRHARPWLRHRDR